MKNQISKQQTIRFKNSKLVEKLNEEYLNSKFNSVNEYFIFCLEHHLSSNVNAMQELEKISGILQDKNLSNSEFEKEVTLSLIQITSIMKKNLLVSLRILGLLRRQVFEYPLDEEKLYEGLYDEDPLVIKAFDSGK